MRSRWGQQRSKGWPSRKPVWTITAVVAAVIFIVPVSWVRFELWWSPLQQFYLNQYMSLAFSGGSHYRLLEVVDGRGRRRVAVDSDVASGATSNGIGSVIPFVLSPEALRTGATKLEFAPSGAYDSQVLQEQIRHFIYHDQSLTDLLWPSVEVAVLFFVISLFVAIPRDLARARERRDGQRLKGPQLVRSAEFNRTNHADGIGFINLEPPTVADRLRIASTDRVRIPRDRESSHLLIMGDSGTGKSALIRQLLVQIEARGETAIVYDPAPEYTAQFYKPERGDVILNPLDERMPYWSPAGEVRHDAEALTLAASLFPEHHRDNPFFIEGPRKVFAHLLTLKPTPDQLCSWLCHEEEIDRRLKGTEFAAMINPGAAAQRAGVLASLNMVADSLKLLPPLDAKRQSWTAVDWAKHRKGWVFLTSTPASRKRLLPLTSLWLDLLVLRLMNSGQAAEQKVWFVLDELASLQKLPQLHTAVTESRKSNNPVVLGFQGRSQLEMRYGQEAEAMLSQPATKIFLRTSEPRSAKWISETIGEVEIERLRESRNASEGPKSRKSKGWQMERKVEPLLLPSEISGLENLHGYVKSGNLVVRMSFPYIQLESKHPSFIEREMPAVLAPQVDSASEVVETIPVPAEPPKSSNTRQVERIAVTAAAAPSSAAQKEEQPFFE